MWLQWPRFMSALLLHLTAVERLAAQVSSLPAEFSRAFHFVIGLNIEMTSMY